MVDNNRSVEENTKREKNMSEGSAAMKPRVGLVRAGALADIAFHNLHDWNLAIPSKEDAFNVIVEEGARMPRDAYRVLASRFPAL